MKSIFGYKMSYAEMRDRAGVTTLRARRIEMCDAFAEKALGNEAFQRWFPLKEGRVSSRKGVPEKFKEMTARTRIYACTHI